MGNKRYRAESNAWGPQALHCLDGEDREIRMLNENWNDDYWNVMEIFKCIEDGEMLIKLKSLFTEAIYHELPKGEKY